MTDALSELSGQPPADPEAQAVVTDFIDYSEFFPSDLFRSLSLIRKLDESYESDAAKVHNLTKTYGKLPNIAESERPDPKILRADISTNLEHALRCRESSYAEASRLCTVADGLFDRLVGIRDKLKSMPLPPSRDPTPAPATRSPNAARSRRQANEKAPQLKILIDGEKPSRSARHANESRQKNPTRRMIVPGDPMPPFDPNSPGASIASEPESERAPSPVEETERIFLEPVQKIKLPKIPKIRPPGVMGTNAHSTVAGISVSNAMASLTPPPENPRLGSQWAPWFELTSYELHVLRRRMKKNANWQPSDIMKNRELQDRGRGPENYRKAKQEADAKSEQVLNEPPHRSIIPDDLNELLDQESEEHQMPHTPQMDGDDLDLNVEGQQSTVNRGMQLNEKKRMKREALLREQALREEKERASASDLINKGGKLVEDIYKSIGSLGGLKISLSGQRKSNKSPNKRKRDASSNADGLSPDKDGISPTPSSKKLRLISSVSQANEDRFQDAAEPGASDLASPETGAMRDSSANAAVYSPEAAPDENIDPSLQSTTIKIPLAPEGPSHQSPNRKSHTKSASPAQSHRKPTPRRELSVPNESPHEPEEQGIADEAGTAEPASVKEPEDEPATPAPKPILASATSTRTTRNTAANKKTPQTGPGSRKRGSVSIRLPKRAASAGSTPRRTADRLISNVSPPSGNAQAIPQTAASRREKRNAPGTALNSNEGGAKISLAPRKTSQAGKKGAAAKAKQTSSKGKGRGKESVSVNEAEEEEQEEDKDQEKYCICGDVSWGDMVACDNECEKDWFHLKCVGLSTMPSKRQKWFCPECREVLGLNQWGKKGEGK